MRDGWVETTLGDVLVIQSGFAFSTNDWAVEGYPVIKINNVRDGKVSTESCSYVSDPVPQGAEKFLLKRGDLLITLTGEIGATGTVDQTFPMFLNQRVGKVSVQDESRVLLPYLAVLFNSPSVRAEMWSLGKGNAQLNISPKSIHDMVVTLPPLDEQRRIVDVVSSVDSYIDALQQQAETARTARNAALHELLSAGGDDWTETTLGNTALINPEATKNFDGDKEITYVDLSSVSAKYGIAQDLVTTPYKDAPGRARRVIRVDDVLVSTVRPYLKGFALVPEHLDGEVASTGFAVLRAIEGKTVAGFIWAIVGTEQFVKHLVDRSTGSNYPAIRPEDVASLTIQLPPLAEQKRIVEIVASMAEVIRSTEQAVVEAKNLRSGLLADLLSGEHEIPESYDSVVGAA